jgi:hypothetical protein
MRPQRLVVSLFCLALGLLAAVAYVQRPGQAPMATSPDVGTRGSGDQHDVPPALKSAAPNTAAAPASPLSWRQVESEDYRQYIVNLRSISCPEQTIRDLIIADVNKLYAARENPLKAKPKPTADNPAGETAEQKLERLRQLRALQLEKRSVVKELLGIDLPLDLLPSSGSRDYHAFEVAFGILPAEKRDAVQFLQESYWQQSDALKAKYAKARTPEFVAESRQLNDSLRQELAKVLTPPELEDYDLRTSPTAKQLSASLATYFRPTEEEFRQMFRAQRGYEDAIGRLSTAPTQAAQPVDPADRQALAQQRAAERQALDQARSSALNQMNEQLKTALGEERYTEYQRSQDRTYDLLARLGLRYGLPQETVLQAYELQKSFSSRPGPSVQPADRADTQRQLNEQLTAILGEQAARGYRRVHGGTVPIN